MSRKNDGTYYCDRCGTDVDNASIYMCSILSDIDFDNAGVPVIRHFCRDRVSEGTKIVGCTNKILTSRNLEYYNSQEENK